jgi:hypothetical protein
MPTYTVTEMLVSKANPNETPFRWTSNASAIETMAVIGRILGNAEETSEHFDEWTTKPRRVLIEVHDG